MLVLRCYMKRITSFLLIIGQLVFLELLILRPVLAIGTPNDPYYGRQWYLSKVKADRAWNRLSDSADIIIAVIDSGVQIDHPDLKNNIWRNHREVAGNGFDDDNNGFIDDINGWDFVNNMPDPNPKFLLDWTEAGVSHGTMVAGIIAAQGNNGEGVVGVTWRAQIMPLKALNDRGEGKISDVIRAIDYATNNGANIINLSFMSLSYSEALQEAIARAHAAGVIIVAAAGNESAGGNGYNIDETPVYPACYDGKLIGENMVIGVAATDALDQKAAFSSYGSRCVDIVAPGISFFNTVTAGSDPNDVNKIYDGYWSGTSLAAPLVSGALALIAQANPFLGQREIVNILFASTDNVSRLNPDYVGLLGNGRLNVERAVAMAKDELYKINNHLILAPTQAGQPARLADAQGQELLVLDDPIFQTGPSFIGGDVSGDGFEELIVGSGPGVEPWIKIFNYQGRLLRQFLAFDSNFRGGLNLAVADLDGDGVAEIVVTAASAGLGEVKIFDGHGRLQRSFLVDNINWRGGLSLAVGDFSGDRQKEIAVGYGPGSEPQIRIFSSMGKPISIFLAYEKTFRGGVNVAAGNLDGRAGGNKTEIIVAPGSGREPLIKIFDNRAVLKKQFLAFGKNWQGGVNVGVRDLNNDGLAEIITAARPGAAPHVRVFNGQGEVLESFYAWPQDFSGGVNVGIINIIN